MAYGVNYNINSLFLTKAAYVYSIGYLLLKNSVDFQGSSYGYVLDFTPGNLSK